MTRSIVVILLILVLLLTTACQPTKSTDGTPTPIPTAVITPTDTPQLPGAVFVHLQSDGDDAIIRSQEEGKAYLEMLGYPCTTLVVKPDTDVISELAQLEQAGYQAVFLSSFALKEYASSYQGLNVGNLEFIVQDSFWPDDHYSAYNIRLYQAYYLAGIAMASVSESKIAGFVAPYGDTQTMRCINAFALGMKSVDETAIVKLRWTNVHHDDSILRQTVADLASEGCDVIAHKQSGRAVEQAAKESGLHYMSYNAASADALADPLFITAPKISLGEYFFTMMQAIQQQQVNRTDVKFLGIGDNVVGLDYLNTTVDPAVQALIQLKTDQMKSGEWDVFTGPIYNKYGLVLPEGMSMQEQDLSSMMWLVDNVMGSVPAG